MTANSMADLFEILYDKVSSNTAPGYTDAEISAILNKAQEKFVYQTYHGTNKLNESFESTEKRRVDLSELIKANDITTQSTTQTGTFPNGTFYDLPSDFLYAIQEEVTISSTDECVNNNRIAVKPITHDRYLPNVNNPFKQPSTDLAWRINFSRESNTTEKRHELITDGSYTISTYHLRYLQRPADIVVDRTTTTNQVDSILDESTHRRMVDIAVELALEITQDQRLQTNMILNQGNE